MFSNLVYSSFLGLSVNDIKFVSIPGSFTEMKTQSTVFLCNHSTYWPVFFLGDMRVGSGKRRGDWRSSKGHSSDFPLAKKIHEKKSSSWGKKKR